MKENKYYFGLISELNFIVEKYKNVSVTSLCNSILGLSIPILTLGEGSEKIVYIGGEVGFDKLTPYILLRYVKDVCSLYQEGGSVFGFSAEYILKKYTLIIIPVLNPDGINYCDSGVFDDNPIKDRVVKLNNGSSDFSRWVGNARGVDLRCNYFNENMIDNQDDAVEQEPEVGALCNFLRFGESPQFIFALRGSKKKYSEIYFGDGERANKIAIALTQMTGYKRAFLDDSTDTETLMGWSNKELGTKTFFLDISTDDVNDSSLKKTEYFAKYSQLRKMMFCAPLLSKIK